MVNLRNRGYLELFFRNYTGASTQTNAEKSLKSTLCLFLIQDGRYHGNAIFRKTKGTPHALHHFEVNLLCVYPGFEVREGI